MFITYALYNEMTRKIYVGQTENLAQRLLRHNGLLPAKKTSFTQRQKGAGVWKIIYQEQAETRAQARKREKELKTASGRRFIHECVSLASTPRRSIG